MKFLLVLRSLYRVLYKTRWYWILNLMIRLFCVGTLQLFSGWLLQILKQIHRRLKVVLPTIAYQKRVRSTGRQSRSPRCFAGETTPIFPDHQLETAGGRNNRSTLCARCMFWFYRILDCSAYFRICSPMQFTPRTFLI